MLGELDCKRIGKALAGLDATLELQFHPDPENEALSAELGGVARQVVAAAAGTVSLREGDGLGLPARPALTIGYGGKANIHYLAVPEGPEILPFIEAFADLPRGATVVTDDWARKLAPLTQPATLFVFMATTCPNCPAAVRAANQLALTSYQVTTCIIDAQRFPALAEHFAVKSVPVTILDGAWSVTGVVPPAMLVEKILAREDPAFQQDLFQSLVEAGRFADTADYIMKSGAALFTRAWRKSTTSSRMGLLLVVEDLLPKQVTALDDQVEELIALLASEDAALRGDTADLLGQIGLRAAAEALGNLHQDPNPDVAEIAAESVEMLGRDR